MFSRALFARGASALIAACLVVTGLVVTPSPVHAADTGWHQPTTDPLANHLLTMPSGNVMAVGCNNDTPTSYEQFSAAGAKLGTLTGTKSTGCNLAGNPFQIYQESVVTKDGVLVRVETTPVTLDEQISAYRGSTLLWTTILKGDCAQSRLGYGGLVVGADGDIYSYASESSGDCPTGTYNYLFGLKVGDGSQKFFTKWDQGIDQVIGAYQSGLVVERFAQYSYVSYAGVVVRTVSVAITDAEKSTGGYLPMVGYDGHIYTYWGGPRHSEPGCVSYDENGRTIIISPDGGVLALPVSNCDMPAAFAPAPWGFAAVLEHEDGTTEAQRIVAYNNNGTVLSTVPLPRHDGTKEYYAGFGVAHLWVDTHGNIIWGDNYSDTTQDSSGANVVRNGATFKVVNALTGEVTSTFDTVSLDPAASIGVANAAINEGRLYVLAMVCQPGGANYLCGSPEHTTVLYAVGIAGIGMDEPRGSLIGSPSTPPSDPTDPPPPPPAAKLTVNAGGDSYIATRGAAPFDPQSGSCKRSLVAWPVLVTKTSSMNMALSKFVACSGATSHDMLYGGKNQPKQVNQLKAGADVTLWMASGNDIGFTNLIYVCLLVDCRTASQTTQDKIKHLSDSDKLPALYKALRKQVGTGKDIYVMSYANVMPASGTCGTAGSLLNDFTALLKRGLAGNVASIVAAKAIVKDLNLSWADVWRNFLAGSFNFSSAETTAARNVENALNAKIKAVVTSLKDPHLHFVDANGAGSPWEGHGVCPANGKVRYVNGLVVGDPSASFHPTAAGSQAYASIFLQYYAKHPITKP